MLMLRELKILRKMFQKQFKGKKNLSAFGTSASYLYIQRKVFVLKFNIQFLLLFLQFKFFHEMTLFLNIQNKFISITPLNV